MRRAGTSRVNRYEALIPALIQQKIKQGGILGITKGDRVWTVQWPWCVKKSKESFENPVAACARHNYVLLQTIGDQAILCDPLAAVKLKNFEGRRGRGRPRKGPQDIT